MKISKAKCPNCGKIMQITKAQCFSCGITLEGEFSLPKLANLHDEDQNFIVAFIKVHGSIKKMEEIFDISYPTVKNRLNQISKLLVSDLTSLQIIEETTEPETNIKSEKPDSKYKAKKLELLAKLDKGELSIDEVLKNLNKLKPE